MTTRFLTWVREVAAPRLPGATDETLKAKPTVFVAMLLVLAAMVAWRYHTVDPIIENQLLSVGLGVGACLGLMVLGHGAAAIRRVPRQSWYTLAFCLIVYLGFWYLGRSQALREIWAPMVGCGKPPPMATWAFFCSTLTGMALLPALLFSRLGFRMTPADLGLNARGNPHRAVPHVGWLYAIALVVVVPLVLQAGSNEAFINKYPLWRGGIGRDSAITIGELISYELLYIVLFVGVEGFFRGVMLFGTERGLGAYALPLMCVPYVCSHYGKPEIETYGAILAGVALGWLALKHRSVWAGAGVHIAAALMMDGMALSARGVRILW